MKKILIILCLLLSISAFAQHAKTDSIKTQALDDVTIIGDKNHSLPGAGQYINTRKLEKLNQTNINTALRTVPGVAIRDEEGYGLRPNIGLRGTAVNRSAKITLMEDGILIAPAPYADPSAYYFPTFARMRGLEILKGSSQIKYGPYTIGGAVNLLSTAIPSSFKMFAQASYGSFNTNQQRLWVGDSKLNFDYVFEINRLASQGFKKIDGGGNTGFDRRDMMGKIRWHNKKNATLPQAITLKFVNSTEESNETYLGLTYNDYQKSAWRRYAGTQRDALELSHQHVSLQHALYTSFGLTINTTAYYSKTFRDWGKVSAFGGESINTILNNPSQHQGAYKIMTGEADGSIDYQNAARTYHTRGIQLNSHYTFNTKKITHTLQLGARYHVDNADRYATRSQYLMTNNTMILSIVGIKGNQENQIRSANSLATFLSYDIEYKKIKLSTGIRYENIHFLFQNYGNADYARLGSSLKEANNNVSIFLPGLGLNYELNAQMNIFGGIHRGFSPPGMPSTTSSIKQAIGETSINYELGYRGELKGLNIQTTAFLNNYDNILGSDNISGGGTGSGNIFNAGKAKIQGIELSLGYDVDIIKTIKIPFALAYTYTSAKFQETFVNGGGDWGNGIINKGDLIPFITPHILTTSVGIETKKWDATLLCRYTGKTRIKPGQSSEILPSENNSLDDINSLKQYILIDLSANYKINKTFTLFSLINNLSNSKAIVSNLPQGYRPNMPLSIQAGFKVNL
ncbi:MAG: TonB-dependent receptor [Chitinophagaceae bacterium]